MLRRLNGYLIRGYNWLMRSKLLKSQNKIIRRIRLAVIHNVCVEMKASFGKENQDITFYVIRSPWDRGGLFAVHHFVVCHMKKAVERNAIPIVDMQHYLARIILDNDQVGKINAWELFFEQPLNYTLEEVYRSKNVIMCGGGAADLGEVYDLNEIMKSHKLINQYVKINPKTLAICEAAYQEIGIKGKKVLGVLGRGTDYVSTKPFGHSIVPDAQQTIDIILEKMSEWGDYDFIYLCTEDEMILKELKQYFGNKLIYCEAERYHNTGESWICDIVVGQKKGQEHLTQLNLEYLISIYLLSKCDSLIAPVVGGTIGAMRMKGKYENLYLVRLGNYGEIK